MTRSMNTADGAYLIGDLLGRGGMGQVHAARHPSGRLVVVKQLRDTLANDARMVSRFLAEGRMSRKVSHPNVVRVLDHGTTADGAPYIAMDRARGTTLRELVDQAGPLPLHRVRGLMSQILDGIGAIHAAGVVHGDIKSSNIIVDSCDGTDHATIIDFGLARTPTAPPVPDDIYEDDQVAGTPEYMAPEVFRGELPTTAADLYAAGIIAYEMLVGTTPYLGEYPMRILERQLTERVEFPPASACTVTPALEAVIRRAVDRDPAVRFATAQAFADALADALLAIPAAYAADEPHPDDVMLTLAEVLPLCAASADSREVARRRGELHEALAEAGAAGEDRSDALIVAYLALADALIADERHAAAIDELAAGVALLLADVAMPPRAVWRLELLLAGLYDRLGKRLDARGNAQAALAHAQATGDALGTDRCRALVRRLSSSRGTVLAHGSGPHRLSRRTR